MNKLKQLRKSRGLTQTELAKKVGISEQSVSFYENARRKPKIETWNRLADFFNVSVPYLQGLPEPVRKNRLKELRNQRKLTLDDIEEKTGIKRGTYSNYENGKTEPKLEVWQKLADFFNVSVPYLQNFNDPKKDYCKQKNNKISFKDVFEKEHIVSIEEITQVIVDKIYLDMYEITLWNKFKLIGKYRITPVTMDVINEKLNKFFKRKKIIKPQKFEKTMLKFSEINGVVHEKPLDELKCLFVEIGELETKKFSVQFKNGAPFYIDKHTYNFFKNIFTKRRNKNERQENNI